jgi:hypothetical protein
MEKNSTAAREFIIPGLDDNNDGQATDLMQGIFSIDDDIDNLRIEKQKSVASEAETTTAGNVGTL